MNKLVVVISFIFFGQIICYETNVIPRYIWPTGTISYKVVADSDIEKEQLQKLVDKTLKKFEEDLGTYLSFEPVEDVVNYKRYIYFKTTNLACGIGIPVRMGGSIVELSTDDQCDLYSYLKNLLTVLGFTSPHIRKDRDDFVVIHYDNIYPIDQNLHDKCHSCITSTNDAFKDYDYDSLMHIPTFSYYAINVSKPIISKKFNQHKFKEAYIIQNSRLSETDKKIFKEIYG